ncbi:hypothetical protein FE257_003822 [Aspergillus nanangensis]|uniref:Endoplasmic reticulum junction formation protein lunapark n=1 Tax=Aspergillus nanangensis TaxID=2582783 RepID=A0AAD4CB98_ASPNN|nr:hypothetical protein FE257_003822 [Aspergillus nanangensis]
MVSLWPFKGQDNSPASFEKALSALSKKIAQTNTRLDSNRQHARRFKALWTLYTTFAYLLYTIIVALVLGWENWGVTEFAALVGGPVVIYGVRAGASKFFDYRIHKTQRYLDGLQKQRDETIEKLKVATKYNSTQQLLEKYAGEPSPKQPHPKGGDIAKQNKSESKRNPSTPQQSPGQWTGLAPPPTANIQHPSPQQSPQGPSSPDMNYSPPPFTPQPEHMRSVPPPSEFDDAGFAPNAFPSAPQYIEQHHWYDRLFDVLLGEDETQPKNRIALICTTCRLVNGQAPPGVKTLEELGQWRCGGCGAWNGEESEAKKVLAEIRNEPSSGEPAWDAVSKGEAPSDVTDDAVIVAASEGEQVESRESDADTPDEIEQPDEEPSQPTRRSKRGRPKGSKKQT